MGIVDSEESSNMLWRVNNAASLLIKYFHIASTETFECFQYKEVEIVCLR